MPLTTGIPKRPMAADAVEGLQQSAEPEAAAETGPPHGADGTGRHPAGGAKEPKATRRVAEAHTFLNGCLPVAILARRYPRDGSAEVQTGPGQQTLKDLIFCSAK